jgi:hypothetical protein
VLSLAPEILVAVAGLAVDGYCPDMPRAAQALGGGDLVTLVLAAPLLTPALALVLMIVTGLTLHPAFKRRGRQDPGARSAPPPGFSEPG